MFQLFLLKKYLNNYISIIQVKLKLLFFYQQQVKK